MAPDDLGRIVRETWVQWAREQPRAKPSWLVPWADLDEGQREVDRRIGAAVAAAERKAIAASLRSLPVLDFLHRHGLEPGASGRPLLCAAAAEIEGPGAPGCEQHPGPQEARDG